MEKIEPSAGDRMAAMRTELAFQRTRIATERTMMAIMRTSLSLIGFGFTIFSFFNTLSGDQHLGSTVIPDRAPGRFGLALVFMGVALLVLGIFADRQLLKSLRRQRQQLVDSGLSNNLEDFPPSLTQAAAIALLMVGLAAILIIMHRM